MEAGSFQMSVDALSDEFIAARLEDVSKRVKPKRFRHIEGVADTAARLAKVYGVDERKARLAGVLHDWDKGLRNGEIRDRIYDLGIEADVDAWIVENMPEVLHGPTAATALSREFPEIPDDVLTAIWRHTTAATDMSDLDKVLYVADALEPSRKFKDIDGLRSLIGEVTLDELFYEVYRFWTVSLIRNDVVLHPDTIRIWNDLAYDRSKAKKEGF